MLEQISVVREFNRFYTTQLGLLRRRHLGGEFSLTEARVLYEIAQCPGLTAATLCATLELDPGYLSRLLGQLTKRGLVRQGVSKRDAREKRLSLSAAGKRKVAQIDRESARQIRNLLRPLSPPERNALVESLKKARLILEARRPPSVRVVRLHEVGDAAMQLLEEYYDAVQVVRRDDRDTVRAIAADRRSGLWIAYLEDTAVGCVVLRRLDTMPSAGECKRLYVRPEARGLGIADALLDAQETYARRKGLRWIYLDTYGDLKAAVALYRKRGYRPCGRYNDNPQATMFFRKDLGAVRQ